MVDPENKYLNSPPWDGNDFPGDIPVNYDTFEDFLDSYDRYLRYLISCSIPQNDNILAGRPAIILTLSSALIQGCVKSGKSLLEGGALYNQTFPNFTCLVTAADSLAAIKKCVYEDKKLTLEQLAELCRDNFEGNETMRQYLLNKCPKYGNDDPQVDIFAKFIYDIIADEIAKYNNIFGAAYAPQYFGFHAPSTHAYTTAATPDGRRHGEAPSGTFGGDMGRETKGLTALFNSATSFDHTFSSGGLNVNARLSPMFLDTEENIDKMIDVLIAYFQKGGMETQINCISGEILRDAQKNPEKHRDLCVRIAGQSAYFVDLSFAFQEQIIKRTEHAR
jgi:formate C-acetyltransferase